MSGVNLDAIYQRLQSIPRYHPMSANTFADWAMEAGDIVTVKRDGTGYASPVGTMTLKWNGKQQIQISTEGSRERDSISKVSARKYARGAGGSSGIRSDRELYWEMSSEDGLVHASIHATEEYLQTDYSKKISDQNIELRGVITQTAESLTSDYTKKIGDTKTELRGVITQTAESLTSDYTKKIGDTNTTLRGAIQQTAASLTSDYTRMIGEEDVAIRSHVAQTAEQINTSIENLETRLSTRINETDSTVSLAVGKVKYSSVQNYANKTNFPTTGTAGVLYHANDTGIDYLYMPGTHSYEKAKTDEYGNANFIKAGEIAITINESGDTEAKLDAKVVYAGANTKQTLAGLELPDWMDTTEGLIAEKASIVSLNALKARVGTLETDYLKTKDLKSEIGNITQLNVQDMTVKSITSERGGVSVASVATNTLTLGGTQIPLGLIIGASVSGNTLTLTPLAGNDITFSKATSLSGAWSGGVYTVTASPQGNTRTIGFSSSANEYLVLYGKSGEYVYTNPSTGVADYHYLYKPTAVGTGNSSGPPTERHTDDLLVDATLSYNAGWNAIGKPSVTFTGLDTQGTPTLGGVSGSASISNKTDGTTRNTSISLSLDKTTYTPNPSVGAQNCVVVKTSGNVVVGRIDTQSVYDDGHSDGYDAGWNAISSPSVTFTGLDGTTLSGVSGKATISNKTDGTGRSTSFSLSMEKTTYTPSPSVGAKDCVVVKTSGGTVVGRIDTSKSVTITSDNHADTRESFDGKVYAGGDSKTMYMTTGSWSGGSAPASVRLGNSSGNLISRIMIDVPDPSGIGYSSDYSTGGSKNLATYTAKNLTRTYLYFKVGGKKYHITMN